METALQCLCAWVLLFIVAVVFKVWRRARNDMSGSMTYDNDRYHNDRNNQ